MTWNTVSLGSVCDVKTGKKDVNEGSKNGLYPFFTCAAKHTFSDVFSFDCEAILIAGNGAVGQTSYYNGKFEAYQRTYVLCNFIGILPQYLLYVLNGSLMYVLSSQVLGNTIPYIKKGMLTDFQVPLPSLQTQQKIVSKLDSIFSEIDKAMIAAEANANNAESLFKKYLAQVFDFNDEYPKVKISMILKLEYGKALPDNDRAIDGKYAAYGANGVKARTNKFLYAKPSIIVGRKGSAGELTLSYDKFWALDVTYYVTHDDDVTDLMYLYYALQSKNLTSFARGVKPGINRNDVYELEIFLPSLSEQKSIVTKLNSIFNELDKANKFYKDKSIELFKLKKSILKQAFNGELVKE